jgi:hypothetical protein
MQWMWNAVWAWIGWNIVAPLLVIALLLIALFVYAAIAGWRLERRQSRCPHKTYYTSGHDAYCSNCRKYLGYIWDVREQRKEQKQITS